MRCMNPQLAWYDSKGNRIFRNFSAIDPQFFPKKLNLLTGCRKCIICRKKQAYELAQRCVLHASMYEENSFITLTYDEKKQGYHNDFDYKNIQDFKKRLRAKLARDSGKKAEIFNVHEYGKNGKKHWHLVVFNYRPGGLELYSKKNNIPIYTSSELDKLWPYGYNTVGDVSEASAMYQAQYMEKDFKNGHVSSNKKSHSKHSGIGKPFFLKHYRQILLLGYIPLAGSRMPLPRYFEKLAHRHYSHFYVPSHFKKGSGKEARYRSFKKDQPNKEIADLWPHYEKQKKELIHQLEIEWDLVISQYLENEEKPDFVKTGENTLYDLKRKSRKEIF